jgi:hypothetical protein
MYYNEKPLVFGLKKAIDEFLLENPEWKLLEKFTNNNGLTILERGGTMSNEIVNADREKYSIKMTQI